MAELGLRSTFNRNAVAPFSPGLAAAATLGSQMKTIQPQGDCVISSTNQERRKRLAVGNQRNSLLSLAQAFTPGVNAKPFLRFSLLSGGLSNALQEIDSMSHVFPI